MAIFRSLAWACFLFVPFLAACSQGREYGELRVRLVSGDATTPAREVSKFFVDFAYDESFTVEDATPRMPADGSQRPLNIQLHMTGVAEIGVITNHQAPGTFFVALYEPKKNAVFDGISERLFARLKERWPETAPYVGR